MTGNRESVIGSVVGGTAAWPLSYVGSKRSHSLAVSRSPAAGEPFDGGVIQSEMYFPARETGDARTSTSKRSWNREIRSPL